MTLPEDELLGRELGKLAAFGAKLGGAPDVAGSLGAGFAAKFLPTERHQIQMKLNADAKAVLVKVCSFFASNGRVASEEEAGESPYPKISGVVGSGFFNMNPAVVHAEILAADEDVCTLLLTGAAKEGLIKQKTAEKAVKRLAEALSALV